ncbi:GNAT family N-acetyltransferase [Paenibacillus sp. UNC451MF]|uniref:GNAT family N-acetyltransferase n=1 Tax=Paenibacillus sp. UNC451MF TaxID=1449063 RepID=UPI00049062B9|nr:GNAT family N-acetyltransferase [Paenibacillus sp. UNC451MF]
MSELQLIKDYLDDEQRRNSLFKLAVRVFGIQFGTWYQLGASNKRYIPFSYFDEDKAVANVSVNLLDLIIDGEVKKAIQIGTVMTHPEYRNRGLSTELMNLVIEQYEATCDVMYLFANQSVLNFYPKFGFEAVSEHLFSIEWASSQRPVAGEGIRPLDGNKKEDFQFIARFAVERLPVSQRFGTANDQGILMFYCLNVFNRDIYYLEQEEVIVIYQQYETEPSRLDIYDIISQKEIGIERVLARIAGDGIKKIVFHYTPDYNGIQLESSSFKGDDVLFVKTKGSVSFSAPMKHPITAQA